MPRRKPPVSEIQLAANRANAANSTGPRTPEGKARSAQNARKHGFTASTFAVVRLEDLNEVAHLRDDLIAVYQPVNSQELFAIERIALAQQAILRAARLETGLFTSCLNEALDSTGNPMILMSQELAGNGDIEITRAQNRNWRWAKAFVAASTSPTVGPSSSAIRPRPNATTAAQSRNSNGSKPCGPNYQTKPISTPTLTKHNHLHPLKTNPI